jgi:hypothetical protein
MMPRPITPGKTRAGRWDTPAGRGTLVRPAAAPATSAR